MGPAVCVQAKVSARPAGSELAVPSRVTKAPEAIAWSGPASAIGAAGGGGGGGGLTGMVAGGGGGVRVASLTRGEKVRLAAGSADPTVAAASRPRTLILVAAVVWRVLPPAIRSGAAIESMAARKSIEGFLAFPLTFAAWMLPFDAWSPWTLTTWPTSCERVDGALSNSVFSST